MMFLILSLYQKKYITRHLTLSSLKRIEDAQDRGAVPRASTMSTRAQALCVAVIRSGKGTGECALTLVQVRTVCS